ncbi:hypothetical protein SLEP1_g31394 [Rubroshorea leprosula]|uniref:Uncharacterized protein n=1 Tax=Rubroshorea leprosula TaxID=152421 RepID=A0AAV5KAD1_9ROSI|nr:hypothetical protein SLEP1_g31394 [Rubroshorea leprosula]
MSTLAMTTSLAITKTNKVEKTLMLVMIYEMVNSLFRW